MTITGHVKVDIFVINELKLTDFFLNSCPVYKEPKQCVKTRIHLFFQRLLFGVS